MNKFNEVNISIKKALITKVSIELKEENGKPKPIFTVTGSLMTEQNKAVSDFYFSNEWYVGDDKKIEIPVGLHLQVSDIFKILTPVVYEKLNDTYKQIDELSKVTQQEGEIVNEPTVDDDEIPF